MFRHGHFPEMLTRRNHHRCLAGWIYEDQPDTQQPLTSRHLLGRSRRRHSGIARPDEFLELSGLPYFGQTAGIAVAVAVLLFANRLLAVIESVHIRGLSEPAHSGTSLIHQLLNGCQ
jgi:hypothetical protein